MARGVDRDGWRTFRVDRIDDPRPAGGRFTPQVPPGSGIVEAVDGQTCRLTAGGDSLTSMAMHLALLGHAFTVEEPAELVEEMDVLAERLRSRGRGGGGRPGRSRP